VDPTEFPENELLAIENPSTKIEACMAPPWLLENVDEVIKELPEWLLIEIAPFPVTPPVKEDETEKSDVDPKI